MRNGVKLMAVKKKLPSEVLEFFKKQGSKGGRIGGKLRLEKITPERRSEIAQKAAAARWKNKSAGSARVKGKRHRGKAGGPADV